MKTIATLASMKAAGDKIAAIALYDAEFSRIFNAAGIDAILVGDSVGMTVQGHRNPIAVTVEDMCYHTRCVARGNQQALLISDLPFMSYSSVADGLKHATQLMQAGAHMVKLETTAPIHVEVAKALSEQGIPVCSHIGLTPQSIHALGKFAVQGKESDQAKQLLQLAKTLDAAGSAMIVLECMPVSLAKAITATVRMPTIGIGSGPECGGQILVSYDMLGITTRGKPYKFVRNFLDTDHPTMIEAASAYVNAIKDGEFPAQEHMLAP